MNQETAMACCVSQRILRNFALLVATVLVLGCAPDSAEPPKILADRTACSKCRMLLSETQYAAAFRQEGEERIFDDIGCMLSVVGKQAQLPSEIWVRDVESNQWLDARTAVFVYSKKQATPMNYGYVASRDANRAAAIAKAQQGRVLRDFASVLIHFKKEG